MSSSLAEAIKRQQDKQFNQQRMDSSKMATYDEDEQGNKSVANPPKDLAVHKTSGDHDTRYYTKAEIDASREYWEPLANGNATTPELIFYNGDIVMGKVII